jgi:hypothetical protein
MIHLKLRKMNKKHLGSAIYKAESRPVLAGTGAGGHARLPNVTTALLSGGVSMGLTVTRSIILVRKLGQRTLPPKYNNGKNYDLFQTPYFCRCQHSV